MCALLAVALLACCLAVGHAGVPNSWSEVALSGACPGALSGHGTAEAGGLLYLLEGGGYGASVRLTRVDLTNGVCTRLDASAGVTGTPPQKRSGIGFAALDGILYVFGGMGMGNKRKNELHAYTIASRVWRQLDAAANVTGSPPSARRFMGFSAGAVGLLVTFGDTYRWQDGPRSAHFFNVSALAWVTLPEPPAPTIFGRRGPGQAILNGRAYVFGGRYSNDYYNDIFSLKLGDPAAQWAVIPAQGDVPAGRHLGALVPVGQQLLLFGGSSDIFYNDIHTFSPSTGAWVVLGPGPNPV